MPDSTQMRSLPYNDFLNALIDEGLESVREHESAPRRTHFRDGANKGFEECRGLTADQLLDLLKQAGDDTAQARTRPSGMSETELARYWYLRSRKSQIQWVNDVVQASIYLSGGETRLPITARAVQKVNALFTS